MAFNKSAAAPGPVPPRLPPVMMNIEADVREIQQQVAEISKKLDQLQLERETICAMKLSERSLYTFLEEEPDLYSVNDIRSKFLFRSDVTRRAWAEYRRKGIQPAKFGLPDQ